MASLDSVRQEFDDARADATPEVASELATVQESLTDLPDDDSARKTELRKARERLSEIEHDAAPDVAGRVETIQQELQMIEEDVGY